MADEDAGTARPSSPPVPRTLAEKVDHLFRTVRPSRGEYTYEQVATAVRQAGGPTISSGYLWALRKGQRDNPTLHHLEALASFFGVPAQYFFDDETSARTDEQLALVAALRDSGVRKVALRASGLSAESLSAIVEMVERVRALEGITDASPPAPPAEPGSQGARHQDADPPG